MQRIYHFLYVLNSVFSDPPKLKDGTGTVKGVVGKQVKLSCQIYGRYPIDVIWFKNNKQIPGRHSKLVPLVDL